MELSLEKERAELSQLKIAHGELQKRAKELETEREEQRRTESLTA